MADKPKTPSVPGLNPKAVHIGGESIVDRILPHMKKILITIGVVTVVLTIIFTRKWWIERGESKETAKVETVLLKANQAVRYGAPEQPNAKEPTFETTAERANQVLAEMATQGVDVSPAYRAGMLLDAGKLDDAIALYKTCTNAAEFDGLTCREGLGLALEAKASIEKDSATAQKGYQEALDAFVAMQPDPEGPRYAHAMYHQGRMLQLMNRFADAKTAFEKAKEAAHTSQDQLSDLIEKRLAALGSQG